MKKKKKFYWKEKKCSEKKCSTEQNELDVFLSDRQN